MTKWLVRLGTLSKDAHWHKKLDNVQMFALAGFACLFYEYFCKRFVLFFASDFSFSGSSHVVGLLLMKSRKGLAYDIMNISAAHDLFMTSNAQNARHKMASFMDVFSRLSNSF